MADDDDEDVEDGNELNGVEDWYWGNRKPKNIDAFKIQLRFKQPLYAIDSKYTKHVNS